MADFVPKNNIDPNAPNWTGASRGPDKSLYGADRSFEALFSGAGAAVSGMAKAAYTGIVEKIGDEWNSKLEPVRDAQGVGDMTDAATVGLRHPAGSPPQMASFKERADKLTQAHAEGRINPGYYYAQLNAMSKEMRSKYPGFRDEVDHIIQKTTGVVPANALRNAVLQQLQANRTNEEKTADKNEAFVRGNLEYLTPTMRARMAQGGFGAVDVKELAVIVSERKGVEERIKAGRASLEYDESLNKNNSAGAATQFQTEARDIKSRVVGTMLTELGQQATAATKSGQPLSTQDTMMMVAKVDELILNTRNSLQSAMDATPEGQKKSLKQYIGDPDKARKLIEEEVTPLLQLKDMLVKGEFSLAKWNAQHIAMQGTERGRQVLDQHDGIANANALRTLGGDNWIAQIVAIPGGGASVAGLLGDINKVMSTKRAVGKGTFSEHVEAVKKAGGGAEAIRQVIAQDVATLANPNTPPEIRKHIAESTFNSGSLNKFKRDQRGQVYRMLASPEVSKQMIALKDVQPEVFNRYSDWIMKSFFQVHKQLGDNVNSVAESQVLKAKFNPATNQFELGLTDTGMREVRPLIRGALTDPMEAARRHIPGASGLIDSVNEMNKNIKVLEPTMKAKGLEVGPEMDKLFKMQGVLPDAPKKKGWLGILSDGVKDVVSKAADGVGGEIKKEAEAVSGFFGGSQLNFQQASGGNEGTGSQASLNASTVDAGSADVRNLQPKMKKLIDDLANEGIVEEIEVRSGFRDPARNRRAGGAKYSRHMQGDAIDIDVSGMTDEQKAQVLETVVGKGAKGIGIYPGGNSLHIDMRDTPTTWGYSPFGKYRGVDWSQQPAWAHGPLKKLFGAS